MATLYIANHILSAARRQKKKSHIMRVKGICKNRMEYCTYRGELQGRLKLHYSSPFLISNFADFQILCVKALG